MSGTDKVVTRHRHPGTKCLWHWLSEAGQCISCVSELGHHFIKYNGLSPVHTKPLSEPMLTCWKLDCKMVAIFRVLNVLIRDQCRVFFSFPLCNLAKLIWQNSRHCGSDIIWWLRFGSSLYPRPTKLEGGYTGFTLSVRPSVRLSVCPSVCRRHGFRSISQVCFGISISNFICMLMVAIGRSLLIFSDVTFKMATWRPYWIFWFPDSDFTLALNINFKLQRHNTYLYG